MTFDIVYVCDASPAIGMGHLARAVNVLSEIRNQAPRFSLGVTGGFSDSALEFLEQAIADGVTFFEESTPSWSSGVIALDTMAEPGNPVALDVERAKDLRGRCRELVLVSSSIEVETTPEVDVLIDHMPEVRIRGPRPSQCFLGLEYAPVAPEFFEVEPVPLERAETLVAVIGGSDHQTGPEILADLLSSGGTGSFRALEMVVSPHYPAEKLKMLRRNHPQWTFHQNAPSIAPLMARARAVVCTYGNATYESLALGRPTFVLGYKEFQEQYAGILESMDLVVNCGLFDAPRRERLVSLHSSDVLFRLAERARSIRVGCGASSIARVLCEEVARVQDA